MISFVVLVHYVALPYFPWQFRLFGVLSLKVFFLILDIFLHSFSPSSPWFFFVSDIQYRERPKKKKRKMNEVFFFFFDRKQGTVMFPMIEYRLMPPSKSHFSWPELHWLPLITTVTDWWQILRKPRHVRLSWIMGLGVHLGHINKSIPLNPAFPVASNRRHPFSLGAFILIRKLLKPLTKNN